MPAPYSVDDYKERIDSLYRLVFIGSRRANQISKNESHGFGTVTSSIKPTMTALEEIIDGKVDYYKGEEEEETISGLE